MAYSLPEETFQSLQHVSFLGCSSRRHRYDSEVHCTKLLRILPSTLMLEQTAEQRTLHRVLVTMLLKRHCQKNASTEMPMELGLSRIFWTALDSASCATMSLGSLQRSSFLSNLAKCLFQRTFPQRQTPQGSGVMMPTPPV
jgi:hypothetical protein